MLSEENNFSLVESSIESFGKIFKSLDGRIQMFNGDLFQFSSRFLNDGIEIGAVLDKGSLIAIDPELRGKYFELMKNLCAEKCRQVYSLIKS